VLRNAPKPITLTGFVLVPFSKEGLKVSSVDLKSARTQMPNSSLTAETLQVQWAIDFCQSNLTCIYPHWPRPHIEAYNAWAQTEERMEFALNE
jgi:hypothetical protein